MKRLLLLLITILSLGTHYLNASNLDTLLVKEYEACRAELLHIIDDNNLRERLMGYPFYAYMVGQLWMIVVNMGEKTTLFLKEGDSSRLASLSYLCALEYLKGPFSLFDLDIANNRWLNEQEYNPLFRYFVLFSPDGCVQYEWSSSTYCDDNERILHTLGKCASFVLGAFITCPELHEDVWKKEYYKQPFKGEGTGIFIGPYQDKPQGMVFYHIDNDTYEVAAGKWFEEYPRIYDTVLKKFNPSPERTSAKYGVIEQQNEFYPYGESIDTDAQFTSDNPYKWCRKEWDEDQGAYDFGARMYSAADARWTTMDPLSEKYYHISPYAYCAGNPVNLVDPDERDWFYYSVDGVSDPTWNWRYKTKVEGLESIKVQVIRSDIRQINLNCFFDNTITAIYKRK